MAEYSWISDLIDEARYTVSRYIHKTPLDHSRTFSEMAGFPVLLKYENLQKTGSFKVRGAIYKISKIKDSVNGVVAASAGNHAQGVAYAARSFGIKAVIVMPENASISKVEATRSYGAEVILYGSTFDDALAKAREIASEKGYELVHAFDDPYIIAGQGTLGVEILEDDPGIDTIVVPIGGGGLISGIALAVKRIKPSIRIIGVEPENAASMKKSLEAGKPVKVEVKPTIADGLAVKSPGKLTFSIVRDLVDDIVTVSEKEISRAVYLLLERSKTLAEGAGAASLAAILSGKAGSGKTVAVISGGNIDLTLIYRIVLHGLASNRRISYIEGYVPDMPGVLARISSIIASRRGNILDVIHDRVDLNAPAWHTRIKIIFEIPGEEEKKSIENELRRQGFNLRVG
ncbi:MAG: threonine ammonia-lyase [Desulfurococcales archaeon]|nr:threonine ammonia-lyase [Desulfurococcales archaeon]